jgi:hypothetical protein
MRWRLESIGLASLLASAVAGCGPGSPASATRSTTEATVTGRVTANGSPVSKGKVAVNSTLPPFVEQVVDIGKDGNYKVTTYVGVNAFSVRGTGSPAEGGTYNKANRDVKEGSNTIDLVLPLKD